MRPPACPVAAIAREAGALIAGHRRNDERALGMAAGAARTAAGMADRAVMDRVSALEELAARTRARSLEGALFQLVLAKADADDLRDCAAVSMADDAEAAIGRVHGLLHSAMSALEDVCGVRREAFVGEWYMRREYDPHAAVTEALAGEGVT